MSISELGLDLDCFFSYKKKPLRVFCSSLSESISELGFNLDSFFSTKQNLCDCCYALLTRSRALATRAESDEKRQRRVWCHCCQLSHGTCRIPSAPPLILHKATTNTETHQKKPHKNLPKPTSSSSRSTKIGSQKLFPQTQPTTPNLIPQKIHKRILFQYPFSHKRTQQKGIVLSSPACLLPRLAWRIQAALLKT